MIQLARSAYRMETAEGVLRHVHRSYLAPPLKRPALVADAECRQLTDYGGVLSNRKSGEEKPTTALADETRKVQPVLHIDASNGESGVHYKQLALERVRAALNEVTGVPVQGCTHYTLRCF